MLLSYVSTIIFWMLLLFRIHFLDFVELCVCVCTVLIIFVLNKLQLLEVNLKLMQSVKQITTIEFKIK